MSARAGSVTTEGPQPDDNSRPAEPTVSIERAAGLGAMVSLANVFAAVVRSKAAAVFLGPAGVGIVAEVQQVATLALVPLAAFAGPALAQSLASEGESEAPRIAGAALTWTAVTGSILTLLVGMAAPVFLPRDWHLAARPLVLIAATGLVLTALANVATQTLVFRGQLRATTRLQLLTVIVTTVGSVVCTWRFGVTGQLVAAAAAAAMVLPWHFATAKRSGFWPARRADLSPQRSYLRRALSLGATSLVAGVALQGALYAIRWRLELTGGAALNGQFQAAWAIASMYLSMLLSGIANFAFPRFAKARNTEELQREVDSTASFVARFAPPVVFLASAFCGIGIQILYSRSFDPAAETLRWQLAGDVAKCFAWAYAGPLLYRGKLRTFLTTEFTVAAVFAGLSWLLVPRYGLVGVGQAYVATYVLYLAMTATAARLSLGVAVQNAHLLIAAASTAALVTAAATDGGVVVQVIATLVSGLWVWRAGALSLLTARFAQRSIARSVPPPKDPS